LPSVIRNIKTGREKLQMPCCTVNPHL
jgi:hypothetical protein